MKNATMFTLGHEFYDLNRVVDELRASHKAVILELVSK